MEATGKAEFTDVASKEKAGASEDGARISGRMRTLEDTWLGNGAALGESLLSDEAGGGFGKMPWPDTGAAKDISAAAEARSGGRPLVGTTETRVT